MGVRLIETIPEIRMAVQMVTANSRNSRPKMPDMNRMGMNTAASESVIATIVKPISLDPPAPPRMVSPRARYAGRYSPT